MNLLYILERPIQNDLPYQLISNELNIKVTALCLEQKKGKLSGHENINQSVFSDNKLYSFPYEFLGSSNSLLSFIIKADVVVIYGHFHPIFRKGIILTKLLFKKLILTSDASSIQGISGSTGWKLRIKPFLFRVLYNQIADVLFVPSSTSKKYFEQIGINNKKIVLTPYTVNERFIIKSLQNSNSEKLRKLLGIDLNDSVFLFCGKLIERKRAADLLYSLALFKKYSIKLIIIGEGPLQKSLIILAQELYIVDQVIFTGLVPYNELAPYYELATVLVVPAEHEPYGLPINESMICGTPVIASNAVGAAGDLIEEGVTGYTYPVGNIKALAEKMNLFINNPNLKIQLSDNCTNKMKSWSSQTNVDAQLKFFKDKGWVS